MMKRKLLSSVLAVVMFATVMQTSATAVADITIMPIRTVFTSKDRMKGVTVINTSDQASIFRLSFYYMRQREEGGYINMEQTPLDPKYDVIKWISYSPRQIEMGPNANQVVRISLRRPADLPDGEYRAHMKLRRIPVNELSGTTRPQGSGVSTQMTINVGFSVPIIIRQGKNDATAAIREVKFFPPQPDNKRPSMLGVVIDRKGKFSTLGKLNVYWTPDGGSERHVGILNDVNVFTEVNSRKAEVPLTDNTISGGTFRVIYEGDDADKGTKFDEKSFPNK